VPVDLLGCFVSTIFTVRFQKIHFARQRGGDCIVVYPGPITSENYFSECQLYKNMKSRYFSFSILQHTHGFSHVYDYRIFSEVGIQCTHLMEIKSPFQFIIFTCRKTPKLCFLINQ
jgi:hypothetical protein